MKGFRREGRKAFMQTWLTYFVCGKRFAAFDLIARHLLAYAEMNTSERNLDYPSARLWWSGDREVDLDVSALVEAGKPNTVAIRVWNDAEIGGLYRRGFFWSPNEAAEALGDEAVATE